MSLTRGLLIVTLVGIFVGGHITSAGAAESLEGKVLSTNLTACGLVSGKRGSCEGTLTLEHLVTNKPVKTELQITRDAILTLDGKMALLPSLNGATAKVESETRDGKKIATKVIAQKATLKGKSLPK